MYVPIARYKNNARGVVPVSRVVAKKHAPGRSLIKEVERPYFCRKRSCSAFYPLRFPSARHISARGEKRFHESQREIAGGRANRLACEIHRQIQGWTFVPTPLIFYQINSLHGIAFPREKEGNVNSSCEKNELLFSYGTFSLSYF